MKLAHQNLKMRWWSTSRRCTSKKQNNVQQLVRLCHECVLARKRGDKNRSDREIMVAFSHCCCSPVVSSNLLSIECLCVHRPADDADGDGDDGDGDGETVSNQLAQSGGNHLLCVMLSARLRLRLLTEQTVRWEIKTTTHIAQTKRRRRASVFRRGGQWSLPPKSLQNVPSMRVLKCTELGDTGGHLTREAAATEGRQK